MGSFAVGGGSDIIWTGYWLLYRRLKDVLIFFCAEVGANGDHQALTLHFLYMNKCQ